MDTFTFSCIPHFMAATGQNKSQFSDALYLIYINLYDTGTIPTPVTNGAPLPFMPFAVEVAIVCFTCIPNADPKGLKMGPLILQGLHYF
jgi:hypothetical protein